MVRRWPGWSRLRMNSMAGRRGRLWLADCGLSVAGVAWRRPDCGRPSLGAAGCSRWLAVVGCGWLQLPVAGYEWLRLPAAGCGCREGCLGLVTDYITVADLVGKGIVITFLQPIAI